ncbi:gas vesicle protein [Dolichospermum sp. LEGE 00240]|jgi:predicted  nucleic acid-binding Zn-ribbon protein|uniref:gas vesicle protein n=1 Tax=Aphanizomenonaceae TaxID=1892259 RepID=UPI00187FE3B7|nr:gas vesicle protein [Aphanizomenon sp. CS-733/32]MBE9250888.1 gas vesicle protein [Dolichospermum sp. LEGE 00240]MDB9308255.1 gas vesicle protein [Aphanizomenon sp. CS-733/32]
MKSFRHRSIIRAKISTMPRHISEASSQLELYKMVAEKQRIIRELSSIKERMVTLQKRLDSLNNEIENTERTIYKLRQPHSSNAQSMVRLKNVVESNNYQTFEIEY